jgi:hypothetical protein
MAARLEQREGILEGVILFFLIIRKTKQLAFALRACL